jgi:hypothetical protein
MVGMTVCMLRIHVRASLQAFLVAAGAVAAGCADDPSPPDPAPVVWVGEHVELATNGEAVACGGSWEYLDAFVAAAVDDMGLEAGDPNRYYFLTSEELDALDFCPPGTRCVEDGLVYTDRAIDTHELLHAVRHAAVAFPLPGATFFEEGLSVMYQQHPRSLDSEQDVIAALESTPGLQGYMPSEYYGVAGHFTRFLAGEHGVEAVTAFVDDQGGTRTISDLDTLFDDHFGESLYTTLERYRSDYPSCSPLARTRHAVECSRPPVEPEDQAISVSYELTCDDPDVLGPFDGRMWRSFTFDVTKAGRYDLFNGIMPFDFTMEIVDCDRGCLGVDIKTLGEGSIFITPVLDPGRYLVRLSRPVDSPGRVGISIGLFG